MPVLSRATSVVALLFVAVAGAAVIYLNSPGHFGSGGSSASPTPTPGPSGISGWTTVASAVNDLTIHYPADWSVHALATRNWETGDVFPGDALPYADSFVSPGQENEQIGLIVWRMPAGTGAAVDSTEGLKEWAVAFCREIGAPSCQTFAKDAVPMLKTDSGTHGAAILVPTTAHQYAFSAECNSCLLRGATDWITVVVVAREDSFPPASRYGGSVQLLKSVLETMGVVLRGTS